MVPATLDSAQPPHGGADDLAQYIRVRLPRPEADSQDLCLARFETALVRGGCFQSDGTMSASDGTVLAHSHQLMLLTAS
jgi:hypothetical protein